ncbi:hypothetical protein AAC387_Pa03g3669 [Persea americana]
MLATQRSPARLPVAAFFLCLVIAQGRSMPKGSGPNASPLPWDENCGRFDPGTDHDEMDSLSMDYTQAKNKAPIHN